MIEFNEADIPDFLQPGTITEIGSYHFTAQDIIRFAEKFDPQRFHLDAEAAKTTLFGGLCASGWHTVSIWMKLQRASLKTHTERLLTLKQPIAEFGPSPGMKHLKWLKPVFAGDTVSYANTTLEIRQSKSKPQWWILTNHSVGENENNERVIEFTSSVFLRFK